MTPHNTSVARPGENSAPAECCASPPAGGSHRDQRQRDCSAIGRATLIMARHAVSQAVASLCTAHVMLSRARAIAPGEKRAVRALLLRRHAIRRDAAACQELAAEIAAFVEELSARCPTDSGRRCASTRCVADAPSTASLEP